MNDKSYIWFINSHSKGDRSTNDVGFVFDPLVLNIVSSFAYKTSVVGHCFDTIFAKFIGYVFAFFSRETVDNPTLFGPVFLFDNLQDII